MTKEQAIEEFEKANRLLEQAAGHFANGMRLLKGKSKPEQEPDEENEEELVSLMGKERL